MSRLRVAIKHRRDQENGKEVGSGFYKLKHLPGIMSFSELHDILLASALLGSQGKRLLPAVTGRILYKFYLTWFYY